MPSPWPYGSCAWRPTADSCWHGPWQSLERLRNALLEGGFEHTDFGDNGLDVFVRGDIECWVEHADACGRDLVATDTSHLLGRALFDGDVIARGQGAINGG